MSTRMFARLSALAGLIGVVMLIVSFSINPGPPQAHPTPAQLAAFGAAHHLQIMTGGWLQVVGTVLCIAFALALVHLAGAASRLSGWLTFYGGVLLALTSLVEVAFYFSAGTAAQVTTPLVSMDLIHSMQRMYFVVAGPAVFFPLGAVILGSRVLPRAFGYAAILLALLFTAMGIADLYVQLQTVDDVVGSIQALFWLFAPIALLVRSGKLSAQVTAPEPERALA